MCEEEQKQMVPSNTGADVNELKQLEEKTILQLKKTEAQTNIEKGESFVTKGLHFATFLFELFGFLAATIAIVLPSPFSTILLVIAANLELVSNAIEYCQLSKRIDRIEKDKKELDDLVKILTKYQEKLGETGKKPLDAPKGEKVDDLLEYLIQQPEFLDWTEARRKRDEINSKKLPGERWVSFISCIVSLAALNIILATGFEIGLLLLFMIMVDKIVHFGYAFWKTMHAKSELKPLEALKNKIRGYAQYQPQEGKSNCYLNLGILNSDTRPRHEQQKDIIIVKDENQNSYKIDCIPEGEEKYDWIKAYDWIEPLVINDDDKDAKKLKQALDKIDPSDENLRVQQHENLMRLVDEFIKSKCGYTINKNYFAEKFDYTDDRVSKRNKKPWIRGFEVVAATTACLTALLLLLLAITAKHPVIQALIYGAMAIDGLTTAIWTGYQGYRYFRKKGYSRQDIICRFLVFLAVVAAAAAASFLILCQLPVIPLNISATHLAIQCLVYGAIVVGGLITFGFGIHKGYQYAKQTEWGWSNLESGFFPSPKGGDGEPMSMGEHNQPISQTNGQF